MLNIFIYGVLIGLLSSAPMGPVGMLCVQRTLSENRRSGLVTGFGAAAGDMIIAFVAMIAALGLGFNTEFIHAHQEPLQIVGSIILVGFGIGVYKKNPSRNIVDRANVKKSSEWKTFVSSLMLTISNVATLFLYIGLYAHFNIISASRPFGYSLLAIVFIGVGAISWWFFITYIVNKLRGAFNPRGLQIFNKIIGGILVALGFAGIISTMAHVDFLG